MTALDDLHEEIRTHGGCGFEICEAATNIVAGEGNPSAEVMLVGEAPGASEDREGIPFVGASGKLLNAMLDAASIDRGEVFIANVVRCRPPENRAPKPRELRACAGWLAEQIRLIDPKLIVTLGRFALQHFIPDGKITRLQGTVQEVDYGGTPLRLLPLLHPSAVLRNPELRAPYERQFVDLGNVYRNQ